MKFKIISVLTLFAIVVITSGCSSGGGGGSASNGVVDHILERRKIEIKRQAPMIGIPVEKALSTRVSKINLCKETGSTGDGSYSCDEKCTRTECVHAWMSGAKGVKSVEYLFVTPDVKDGTIAHEVHHELIVVWYGIHGHPKRSTVTRLDNGQQLIIDHAAVIGWRWPKLVNWALPKTYEIQSDWLENLKCGSGVIVLESEEKEESE